MLTKTLSEAKKKQRNILIKAMNNDIGSIDSAKDSWNPAQISERAKDISYIRNLVDTWNPAQLNEALRMLDLPVIDTWNPAQIEEQRRNLVFYLAERTLTGNPITLNILGNLTPEVTGLKVTMNPIQSGSGDPSPTNIRPISGRTEASVTRTAGEDVETHTHQYGQTVYGGEDDFVNGGATETIGSIVLDGSETWDNFPAQNGFYMNLTSMKSGRNTESLSEWLPTVSSVTDFGLQFGAGNSVLYACHITDSMPEITDLASWKSYLSTHNLRITFPLATPTTIETSAEEITLLKGTNVLSTDGDSIELKYKQNF